LPHRTMIKVI